MIQQIINVFYRQAKEHKAIKGFQYDRVYNMGSGNDRYPLLWLEDPINGDWQTNIFQNSVNFSILILPKDNNEPYLQNSAFSFGLNILERIKGDADSPINIVSWNYTTLRNYYDDNACGCRFSVVFNMRNMQNLCLLDEQFDKDKEFENEDLLPTFDMSPANNCEIFTDKLPVFDLKTTR